MGVTEKLPEIKETMRETFGIKRFRPGQEEVIRSVMEGHHTLAVMSTGAGKSLCYQLPAIHLQGTTVIVSPLISLMKDQAERLEGVGLEVAQVNSALPLREQNENLEQISRLDSEFVFTTPERLARQDFIDTLKKNNIDVVVIDEAHCISEWGHDFRPAYLQLKEAIRQLGNPPVLALTATATADVIADIKKQLGTPDMRVIRMGIYRPNLHYEIVRATNDAEKRQHLVRLFREIDGPGIVYAATVKGVEEVVEFLSGVGFEVAAYHGKLAAGERRDNQDRFMRGELKSIVATNAFGMGIDKPDIRFVIHYQMPGSLESYYQESGRAGRDGQQARCILLYNTGDRRTQLFFMGGRHPKREDVIAVYNALARLGAADDPAGLSLIHESVGEVAHAKVRVILSALKDAGVVKELRGAKFKLLKGGLTHAELNEVAAGFELKGEKDHEKLERMMLYAQSGTCRWAALLGYFGDEAEGEGCGHCDNCLHPLEEQISPPPKSNKLGWLDLI